MKPLFVYGTLLSTEHRAGFLESCSRTRATTEGILWRLPAGYPALQPTTDLTATVHGELVTPIHPGLLTVLDLYESVETGPYRRVLVPVSVPGRKDLVLAWAYVVARPERHGGVRIPNGRWRSRTWRPRS